MRSNQVLVTSRGPQVIEINLPSEDIFEGVEAEMQEIVAKTVGKVIALTQAQLKHFGVHTEFKQV